MAKIYREGVQIYPETTPDMVVELSTGKDVKELIGDAKSDMRTLMTGVADGIDPKKYPFKDFGNVMGLDALNDLLDSMHGSSDDMMAGWFRVNNQGILFQILNFATSYANDEYVQMVIGPLGISKSTGKIVTSNTFNVATRRHVGGNSPYWTEWDDLNSLIMLKNREKTFVGGTNDYEDFNAFVDSLHSAAYGTNVYGVYNCYVGNYRNAIVNNQVLSWGGEIFLQSVTGCFSPDSNGKLSASDTYGTYVRKYSASGGWTGWVSQ